MQIGGMNKVEEFWKGMQMTFFKRGNLSYVQDKSYVNQVKDKYGWKDSKNQMLGAVC